MSLLRRFADFMGLTDPMKGRKLTAVYVATPAGAVKIWSRGTIRMYGRFDYSGYKRQGVDGTWKPVMRYVWECGK